MRKVAIACLILALSGCSQEQLQRMRDAQEERARQADERQRVASEVAARRIYDTCTAYGFKPDTDAFATCTQHEVERYQDAQTRQQQIAACKEAMRAIGAGRSGSYFGSIETPQDQKNCEADPQAHIKKQYQLTHPGY